MDEKSALAKMGHRPGMTAWATARPAALEATLPLPAEAAVEAPDFLLAFLSSAAEVESAVAQVLPRYRRGHLLWFAYPKKSGAIRTDISRDHGWEPLHRAGLLPVTQVAIDTDWSALRFRYRDEIRTLTRRQDMPGKPA